MFFVMWIVKIIALVVIVEVTGKVLSKISDFISKE
jgi:hypothetical protein